MIPQEAQKSIDEIKTPSNRLLIIFLVLSVGTLFTIIIRLTASNDSRYEKEILELRRDKAMVIKENDSLKRADAIRDRLENIALKEKIRWQDSIKNILENIINQKKR